MRRALVPACAAALLAAGACGGPPGSDDFRGEAESYIEDENSQVSEQFGGPFTDATCDEPTATAIGTRFTCTATDPAGATVQFPVEIVGDNEIAVEAPTAGAAPAGTAVPGTTPVTTIAG